MSTIIYLSNQQIKIITGTTARKTLKVRSCYETEAPNGTLINGMVMDSETFAPFIKSYLQDNHIPTKDVSLVINSTNFFEKVSEMPVLKDKKAREYIEREFVSVDRNKDPIYAYYPMSVDNKKKLCEMYVESADTEYLQSFVELFQGIGIKLQGIYSGLSSVIGMLTNVGQIATKTYLLQIVDGNNLTNIIWVNGSYYYSSSNRLFHNPGTPDFARDIGRSVSQIQQFMMAHKVESNLECIYMAGVSEEDFKMCKEEVQPLIDSMTSVQMYMSPQAVNMPCDSEFQHFMYPVCGLYKNVPTHNFLLAYGKKSKETSEKKTYGMSIIIIGAAFVVAVIAVIVSAVMYFSTKGELNSLKKYNSNPVVLSKTKKYDEVLAQTAKTSAQYKSIKKICQYIDTYPVYSSMVEAVIKDSAKKYADVEMEGFTAADGVVTFRARSKNIKTINKFIRVLRKQHVFQKIDYSGYSYQQDLGAWDINVTCVLAGEVGK